jgi:hypothetical protein
MPCVFWDHLWQPEVGKAITALINIRTRNNIVSGSKLEILAAHHDMYVARVGGR